MLLLGQHGFRLVSDCTSFHLGYNTVAIKTMTLLEIRDSQNLAKLGEGCSRKIEGWGWGRDGISGLTGNLVESKVFCERRCGWVATMVSSWKFSHSRSQSLPCNLYPIPCHPKIKYMGTGYQYRVLSYGYNVRFRTILPRFASEIMFLHRSFRNSTSALSEIDEELETSLYSDDVSEEVREWIATTFARPTPGMRRKSLARRHTFRSVVQAVKASLYVKRSVSIYIFL